MIFHIKGVYEHDCYDVIINDNNNIIHKQFVLWILVGIFCLVCLIKETRL